MSRRSRRPRSSSIDVAPPSLARPGTLTSTINSLIRAQHGSALDDVEDSDMDKRIADMMVQDAKERQKQWGQTGYTAYLEEEESDGPKRKTNKRFLTRMIKDVDTHNQALIREELDSAQRAQRDVDRRRGDSSRSARLFGSAMQSAAKPSRSSEKGKMRAYDDDDEEPKREQRRERERSSRRHRSRSRSDSPRRHRRSRYEDDEQSAEEEASSRRKRWDDESRSDRRREERSSHRSKDEKRSRDGEEDSSRRKRRSRDDDDSRIERRREERSSKRYRDDESAQHGESSKRSRSKRTPDESNRDRSPRPPSPAASAAPPAEPGQPTQTIGNDAKKSNGASKLSKAELADLHPTELFLLNGSISHPRAVSPPEDTSRRRKPARQPSPIARVRAPSHDEEDDLPRGVARAPKVVAAPASKMDKYFDAAYDPRLDVSLADITDPTTGMIGEGAFDDWNTMLELMKARKEYKREKEIRDAEAAYQAQEAEAARKERKRKAKEAEKDRKRRRELGVESDDDDYGPQPPPKKGATTTAKDMFGYRYVKKGSMREWDLGKETPT